MTAKPKAGGLSMLLGGGSGAARESDPAESEQPGTDYEAAKVDAGGAVLTAMKAGDREAFTSALADFVQLCME